MAIEQLPEMVIKFDNRVYRLSAIKKAAYRFSDRCYAKLSRVGDHEVLVTLRARDRLTDASQLSDEFSNEVLDQELREQVWAESAEIRNLLMAQAFSAMTLVDHIGESGDFRSDPLGISRADRGGDPTA